MSDTPTAAPRLPLSNPWPTLLRRLRRLGVGGLRDVDLLWLLLAGGSAPHAFGTTLQDLVEAVGEGTTGNLMRRLGGWEVEGLARGAGLGWRRAARLVSAIEIGRRCLAGGDIGKRLGDSRAVARYAHPRIVWRERETLLLLLLDSQLRLCGERLLTEGTADGLVVHPRDIFAPAVRAVAASIVLAHNHPHASATPSQEDVALTERVAAAGRLVGIPLLDHVVIGTGSGEGDGIGEGDGVVPDYYSFADEGRLH